MTTERHPTRLSPAAFALINFGLCSVSIGFLIWLIYFHEGSATGQTSMLPTLNACFNLTSASLLAAGLHAIRGGRKIAHRKFMVSALVTSSLFLAGYIYYHYSHGDTSFSGQGAIRPLYFGLLISHIVLSIVVLPMILTSVYLALSERFVLHKRLSRWTWGIWMYVSVTGVAVYLMLHVMEWT